jgi:glucose-1-phosphate cytidylyltransferase
MRGHSMKVVILCGGRGTRMEADTDTIPKPMVEIGGKPILWHIMMLYSHYGFHEFILCLGYRGYLIKEYFSHYFLHMSDLTIDIAARTTKVHTTSCAPWKVTLVDTGPTTMTGGRLKRVRRYIGDEPFMMTYGDGIGDINIRHLVERFREKKKRAAVTVCQTAGRFGVLDIGKNGTIRSFLEKPLGEATWINAGFFVLDPAVFEYITRGDATIWEREPLVNLARDGQLAAYKHTGFWKCMDTPREKAELENLWNSRKPPWKVWE